MSKVCHSVPTPDKRLEHAVTELNRGMLEREDYGNILRGIRSLHVES